jgi:hypothetical protein
MNDIRVEQDKLGVRSYYRRKELVGTIEEREEGYAWQTPYRRGVAETLRLALLELGLKMRPATVRWKRRES